MKVLGIAITKPTSKDVFLGGIVTLVALGIYYLIMTVFSLPTSREMLLMMTLGFLAGVLTNMFGVSVAKHGLRAIIILIVVGILLYPVLKFLTGLI